MHSLRNAHQEKTVHIICNQSELHMKHLCYHLKMHPMFLNQNAHVKMLHSGSSEFIFYIHQFTHREQGGKNKIISAHEQRIE